MVTIRIVSKDDPRPADIEGLKSAEVLEATHAVIVEGGMASGRASVALVLRGEDGKAYIAQTSLRIFDGLASAVKGAAARFGEPL
jgi:hypothetical protein